MPDKTYDAIIIGAGQAGVPLSRAFANAGWKTALVEREHLGGTCVNEGCTPTKTMVASGRAAYLSRRGEDYGVRHGAVSVDMTQVRRRKRDIVDSFRGGIEKRSAATPGLDVIYGDASFAGPKTVRVGADTLTASRAIVINTGTRAARPQLAGLDAVPFLDNRTIMDLDVVPEHLLVLGGGYIGLEFGQMFRRFGSRVTVVQADARLLTNEDEDVSAKVREILQEDGIEVMTGTRATSLAPGPLLTVGKKQLRGSHLLVAVGRTPNTETLNLAEAGVSSSPRGFIPVNASLETNVPGIYAVGDVNGGPAFTHISYDDFRILRANLIEGKSVTTKDRILPYTVYIDPQLGRIGLTERAARERRLDFRTFKMPMSHVARALEMDETRGFIKALVDNGTGQILGAAVLGVEGGELCAVIQMGMMGGLRYEVLRDAIFAHPTLAESLNNLFA